MTKPRPHRVVLIGPRGAGKSTLAARLAATLDWPLLDLDSEFVSRSGRTIAEWFRTAGEAAFRQAESQLFRECTFVEPLVVATGGGLVLAAENRQRLRGLGLVVWLDAPPTELAERLRSDPHSPQQRPPLSDARGWEEELTAVRLAREPLYAEVADERLETQGKTLDELHHILIRMAHLAFGTLPVAEPAS